MCTSDWSVMWIRKQLIQGSSARQEGLSREQMIKILSLWRGTNNVGGLSVWQENKWYNVYLLDKRIVTFCRRKLLLEDWVRNLLFSIGQDLTSNSQSQILELSKTYIEHNMTYCFLVDVVHLFDVRVIVYRLLLKFFVWIFIYYKPRLV